MNALLALILAAALLTGCAATKGLEMTDEDKQECAEVGCRAWSQRQLEVMARRFYLLGVRDGARKERGSI